MGVVRKEVEGIAEATRSARERMVHIYETGKAHSMGKEMIIMILTIITIFVFSVVRYNATEYTARNDKTIHDIILTPVTFFF